MQLSPGEQFAITRQLADPFDADASFVRATVRDARTDELLARVTLTDRGDRRFSATYQAPPDVSGLGRWISVTTTVYTDAGFTTLNPSYGEEQSTYLVQERRVNLGGGGGADVDYKKIERLVSAAVSKALAALPAAETAAPAPVVVDLKPLEALVASLRVDLTPVLASLDALERGVALVPVDSPEPDDTLALEAYRGISEAVARALGEIRARLDVLAAAVADGAEEPGGEAEPEEEDEEPEETPAPRRRPAAAITRALRSPIAHPFRAKPKP